MLARSTEALGTGRRGRLCTMGQRMFVAVVPPESVRDHLADFLEPRSREALGTSGLRWIAREQWHITLGFFASVPDHRVDDLTDRLSTSAERHQSFDLALSGAGAFPSVARASVLWLGVDAGHDALGVVSASPVAEAREAVDGFEGAGAVGGFGYLTPSGTSARTGAPLEPLQQLAVNARAAGSVVGAAPDGKTFHPHLTVARPARPIEATKWLCILDTYRSPTWTVDSIELIASHLGEGAHRRPRYETIASIPLGGMP